MAHAKLHIICGNCGSNVQFTYSIVINADNSEEGSNLQSVYIHCGNCSTSHCLDDNAKLEK